MIYTPSTLKLHPLGSLTAGSIGQFDYRNDSWLFVKLSDAGTHSRILILSGERQFQIRDLVHDLAVILVCSHEKVLVRPVMRERDQNYGEDGTLTLHVDGAYISAAHYDGTFSNTVKVVVGTWDVPDPAPSPSHAKFVVYSEWQIGMLDDRGGFAELFTRAAAT